MKLRQDELSKARVLVEAEMADQGVQQVDEALVRAYAEDLQSLLEEADLTERKAFLRSFVKRIEVDKGRVIVNYTLPLPPDGRTAESVGVLPIVTFGGAGGTRTPDLLNAIQTLSL